LAVLCTQQRWAKVWGQTSSRAFQKPRLGRRRQTAALHLQQEFLPGLVTLAVAVLNGDQFLLAFGRGADHHQDALPRVVGVFQADIEVNAIDPDVDVALAGQRPLGPLAMLLFPGGLEAGDGAGREPSGLRPQERRQGFLHVTGGDALEVQPGNQFLDALGAAQVARQDLAGELLLALFRGSAVAHSRLLDRRVAHGRLDRTLGQVAVAHHLLPAAFVAQVGALGQVVGDLGLDGVGEHLHRALVEHLGEQVAGRAYRD